MADFYSSTVIRAREHHVCACLMRSVKNPHFYHHHEIKPGQLYLNVSQVHEGDFSCDVMCLPHAALVDAAFELFRLDSIEYARVREVFRDMRSWDGSGKFLDVLRCARKHHRELIARYRDRRRR